MKSEDRTQISFKALICTIFIVLTAIILIALESKPLGWIFLVLAIASTYFVNPELRRRLLAIASSILVLGILPVKANTDPAHLFTATIAIVLAVALPYLILRYVYNDRVIQFVFHHGRKWHSYEILYVFVPFFIGYLTLPLYFANTHQYVHWNVGQDPLSLTYLLLSLIAVGIWDELFFIATVLGIFRKEFPFWLANILQAAIFTSFLYALGFGGWGFLVCFVFSLIQGYIYKRTGSLLYAITVHVVFDVMLFLALIHAYYPDALPIFIIT